MIVKDYASSEGVFLGSFYEGEQPEGSIEVPSAPTRYEQRWLGDRWSDPIIQPYEVDIERDRRAAMGFVYAGKSFQSASQSQVDDILGKMTDSLAAITVDGALPGDLRWATPDFDFAWSAADGTLVPMDAQTCLEFTRSAVRRKTMLVAAGLALKAQSPIPIDFTDDKYWPPMDTTVRIAAKAR